MPGLKSLRSLFLLSLPVVLLAAGAWLLSRREAVKREEGGPLRTVISKVEYLPVTPLETWEGFRWKIKVTAGLVGKLPPHLATWTSSPDMEAQLRLVWKEGQRSQELKCSPEYFASNKVIYALSKTRKALFAYYLSRQIDHESEIVILCSSRDFPSGGKIWLEGTLVDSQFVKLSRRGIDEAQQLQLNVRNAVNGEARTLPTPGKLDICLSDQPALTPRGDLEAKPVIRTAHVYKAPPRSEPNSPDHRIIHLDVEPVKIPESDAQARWNFGDFEVSDKSGKVIDKIPFIDHDPYGQWVLSENHLKIQWNFPKKQYPPGPLNLSFYVACNDSSPVRHTVRIREENDWYDSPAKKFRVVKTVQQVNRVMVTIRPLNNIKMKIRGEFEGVYDTTTTDNSCDWISKARGRPFLISSWSERIEPPYPINRIEPYLVRVSPDGDDVQITYILRKRTPVKNPLPATFKAEIGLMGDGFLPVSLPLKDWSKEGERWDAG